MLVIKFNYHISEQERVDVVVNHASIKKDFNKRVIGLHGENVQVKDNVLYIDGEEVEEPFLKDQKNKIKSYQTLTNDFKLEDLPGGYETIPEDHVLVLGDNRENSTDSRMFGVVLMDQVVGKTSLIYWHFDRKNILGANE